MTRFLIFVIGILLVAGCSKSELVPVEGQVFYKNQPLTSGVVMFQPAAGPPARGDIQPDGRFTLSTPDRGDGARVGENKVRVSSRAKPPGGDAEIALGKPLIPERYELFDSSGLTAEVKEAGNEPFVFRLVD
jgi:hypothetical protein